MDSELFIKLENFVNKNDLPGLRAFCASNPGSVDERDSSDITLLILCAAMGKVDFCNALLDLGADVNAVDRNRMSALILASKEGQCAVIKLLVERGADINHRDTRGMTPLTWAAYRGQLESSRTLLQLGAPADN